MGKWDRGLRADGEEECGVGGWGGEDGGVKRCGGVWHAGTVIARRSGSRGRPAGEGSPRRAPVRGRWRFA